jgi:hypothetical protein
MRRSWFGFNPSVLPRTLVMTVSLPIPGANYTIADWQLPIVNCLLLLWRDEALTVLPNNGQLAIGNRQSYDERLLCLVAAKSWG